MVDRKVMFSYYGENRNICYYHIPIENSESAGSWYPQQISINALENRLIDRWMITRSKSTGISRVGSTEYNHHCKDPDFKEFFFKDVWDFYKVIGYDHKKPTAKNLDRLLDNWSEIQKDIETHFSKE